ncbi:MAG TPA: hypothetical protein VNW68_05220 [Candidatus Limnocylindria bacterium]|nr:hypothetical protein [Candidatus Limnocylindria bacterium]
MDQRDQDRERTGTEGGYGEGQGGQPGQGGEWNQPTEETTGGGMDTGTGGGDVGGQTDTEQGVGEENR